MALQLEVWSLPLGKERPLFHAAYELDRWQWAEKLAQALRDRGHLEVEVREADEYADEDPDPDAGDSPTVATP
jgi:3-mercaptopyruvate sulfurtransferase SseA